MKDNKQESFIHSFNFCRNLVCWIDLDVRQKLSALSTSVEIDSVSRNAKVARVCHPILLSCLYIAKKAELYMNVHSVINGLIQSNVRSTVSVSNLLESYRDWNYYNIQIQWLISCSPGKSSPLAHRVSESHHPTCNLSKRSDY
jgi:hypothetical protein